MTKEIAANIIYNLEVGEKFVLLAAIINSLSDSELMNGEFQIDKQTKEIIYIGNRDE